MRYRHLHGIYEYYTLKSLATINVIKNTSNLITEIIFLL